MTIDFITTNCIFNRNYLLCESWRRNEVRKRDVMLATRCINASFYLHDTKKKDVLHINSAKIGVKMGF